MYDEIHEIHELNQFVLVPKQGKSDLEKSCDEMTRVAWLHWWFRNLDGQRQPVSPAAKMRLVELGCKIANAIVEHFQASSTDWLLLKSLDEGDHLARLGMMGVCLRNYVLP